MACARIPDGPQGVLCTSDNDDGSRGAFEGNSLCSETPLSFDRSSEQRESWSGELILTSDFDGPFNFLLGGIYAKSKTTDNSYRSEEHTSELQSLMRISYAVFCLKKKKQDKTYRQD